MYKTPVDKFSGSFFNYCRLTLPPFFNLTVATGELFSVVEANVAALREKCEQPVFTACPSP
jgi:hypothetical protein